MAYMGFKKLEGSFGPGVKNPGALAASIGRKKYGKAKFQKAAEGAKAGCPISRLLNTTITLDAKLV